MNGMIFPFLIFYNKSIALSLRLWLTRVEGQIPDDSVCGTDNKGNVDRFSLAGSWVRGEK